MYSDLYVSAPNISNLFITHNCIHLSTSIFRPQNCIKKSDLKTVLHAIILLLFIKLQLKHITQTQACENYSIVASSIINIININNKNISTKTSSSYHPTPAIIQRTIRATNRYLHSAESSTPNDKFED